MYSILSGEWGIELSVNLGPIGLGHPFLGVRDDEGACKCKIMKKNCDAETLGHWQGATVKYSWSER